MWHFFDSVSHSAREIVPLCAGKMFKEPPTTSLEETSRRYNSSSILLSPPSRFSFIAWPHYRVESSENNISFFDKLLWHWSCSRLDTTLCTQMCIYKLWVWRFCSLVPDISRPFFIVLRQSSAKTAPRPPLPYFCLDVCSDCCIVMIPSFCCLIWK